MSRADDTLSGEERDLFDRLADECEDDATARVFELVAQSSADADSEVMKS